MLRVLPALADAGPAPRTLPPAQLGVKATCTLGTGCPPVEIVAEGLPSGKVSLSGSVSSQYLTALLMAAPLATGSGERLNGLAGICGACVAAIVAMQCMAGGRRLRIQNIAEHTMMVKINNMKPRPALPPPRCTAACTPHPRLPTAVA